MTPTSIALVATAAAVIVDTRFTKERVGTAHLFHFDYRPGIATLFAIVFWIGWSLT